MMIAVTVNGKSVTLPSGNVAAIDTGTTLIGGPSAAVAAIYAQIPGSSQLSGNLAGFYGFRMFVHIYVMSLRDNLFFQLAQPLSPSPSLSADSLGPSILRI
jgi:hypothetical protein